MPESVATFMKRLLRLALEPNTHAKFDKLDQTEALFNGCAGTLINNFTILWSKTISDGGKKNDVPFKNIRGRVARSVAPLLKMLLDCDGMLCKNARGGAVDKTSCGPGIALPVHDGRLQSLARLRLWSPAG